MAPLKVYGIYPSTCTMRVLATIFEKNGEYELIPVDITKGEQKQPAHLARQPFGQIPVVEDGDLQVFESRAIARYVCMKYQGQGNEIFGPGHEERTRIDSWLEAESANYNPAVSAIVAEKVFAKMYGRPTNEQRVEESLAKLNKVLDVYEGILSKRPYLAGNEFSLADLSHLSYTHYMYNVGGIKEPIDSHPSVKAWWEKISSRPSWQKVLELQPKY
jgi:glutathione S-transferase